MPHNTDPGPRFFRVPGQRPLDNVLNEAAARIAQEPVADWGGYVLGLLQRLDEHQRDDSAYVQMLQAVGQQVRARLRTRVWLP